MGLGYKYWIHRCSKNIPPLMGLGLTIKCWNFFVEDALGR